MPRFLNAFCSSFAASASSCGISVGSISTIVTSLPKRSKIDANSQPMMPPPRTTRRRGTSVCGEQAGRVDAARRVEARDRRPHGYEPVATMALLNVTSSRALDGDRGRAREPAGALDPLDAVRLEEAGDAAGHLLDDAVLPGGRLPEVELRLGDADAELRERLAGVVERVRGLHPGLGRDAPDAQAGAAELRLLLDADDLAPELGGANRCGVPGRPASEDGDVTFHAGSTFRRCVRAIVLTSSSARSVKESSVSST